MAEDWMNDYREGKTWGGVTCSVCGRHDERGVTLFRSSGSMEYCNIHAPYKVVDRAKNPFQNFTLEHVRTETGKKITVNSLSELRAAEKKYNFALAVASDDGGDTSAPPQHEPWAGDIAHDYRKKFNRDPAAYKAPAAKKGVSSGVVATSAETLAHHPNPV